jgi:hypothetical protein
MIMHWFLFPILGGLASLVSHVFRGLGIPAVIVFVAAGILLMSLSAAFKRWVRTPRGMAVMAGVLVVAMLIAWVASPRTGMAGRVANGGHAKSLAAKQRAAENAAHRRYNDAVGPQVDRAIASMMPVAGGMAPLMAPAMTSTPVITHQMQQANSAQPGGRNVLSRSTSSGQARTEVQAGSSSSAIPAGIASHGIANMARNIAKPAPSVAQNTTTATQAPAAAGGSLRAASAKSPSPAGQAAPGNPTPSSAPSTSAAKPQPAPPSPAPPAGPPVPPTSQPSTQSGRSSGQLAKAPARQQGPGGSAVASAARPRGGKPSSSGNGQPQRYGLSPKQLARKQVNHIQAEIAGAALGNHMAHGFSAATGMHPSGMPVHTGAGHGAGHSPHHNTGSHPAGNAGHASHGMHP